MNDYHSITIELRTKIKISDQIIAHKMRQL